jgi:regulator of replication initiation timing
MPDSEDDLSTKSYWPSVADLFLTLFIIAIAIVAVVFAALLPTNNLGEEDAIIQAVGNDLRHVREPLNELRLALKQTAIPSSQSAQIVLSELDKTCHEASVLILDLEKRLVRLLAQDDGGKQEAERFLRENQNLRNELQRLQHRLSERTSVSDKDPQQLANENSALKKRIEGLLRADDKPPIIQISENEGEKQIYRFAPASSEMDQEFIDGLVKHKFGLLADMIFERQTSGLGRINTLEIIGHTDPSPLKANGVRGNLDDRLPKYLQNEVDLSSLNPGSNNDLGLLRALAVKEQWNIFVEKHPLRDVLQSISVRCYSAGQTIPPFREKDQAESNLDKEALNKAARRIELRLTLIESEDQGKRK